MIHFIRYRRFNDQDCWPVRILLIALLLAGMSGFVFGSDPPAPYNQLYDQFRDKVSHGLTAHIYVGVKPTKGQATSDDLWLPSGSYGMTDGVYRCFPYQGRTGIEPVTTNLTPRAAVSGVAAQASPFTETRVGVSTPDTTARVVGGVSTSSQAITVMAPITIRAPIVARRGGTSIPCTTVG